MSKTRKLCGGLVEERAELWAYTAYNYECDAYRDGNRSEWN